MEHKIPWADQRNAKFPYPLYSSATSVAPHLKHCQTELYSEESNLYDEKGLENIF